jgi:hypothetical protein
VGDNLCGQGEIVEMSGGLAYKVQVAADTGDDCGALGRTVVFQLDDSSRLGISPWDNRQAWFLPLPSVGGGGLYLPIIAR